LKTRRELSVFQLPDYQITKLRNPARLSHLSDGAGGYLAS
jgi:hypothetical protein